jgi:hypothetical protein
MYTAEPLVHQPSSFEIDIANEKLKRYKSPGSDKILAQMMDVGGDALCSAIHKLIDSI